jgi:hypothetical protein
MNRAQVVRWVLTAVAIASVLAGPLRAESEPVAMVTDLQGRAVLDIDGQQSELAILAEVPHGALLKLDDGARLVLVYLQSGQEYTLKGPAEAYVRDDQLVPLSGAEPQRHDLAPGDGAPIQIKPLRIAQAALVMRSASPSARIKLISPLGTRTLEARPEFRWQALEQGAAYEFTLADSAGGQILKTAVNDTVYRLPEAAALKPGATYSWQVEGRLPGGRRYSSWGDIQVVSEDDRQRVEALRPSPDAPFSQRVVFAAWLEQQHLRDEARKYWAQLAAERGGEPALRALAGQ